MCPKKNIKNSILSASRDLFNEYSWSKVSLRRIASQLNISDGNLRYHFKTKEDIVLELFTLMTQEMSLLIDQSYHTINDFEIQFQKTFKIMYAYRFLFIEAYYIKKEYESYSILFNQLEESRKQLFIDEFNQLIEKNILSDKFSEQQYEMLFEQLFIISDSWIKYLDSSDATYVNQKIDHYSKLCFALFKPYWVVK